MNRFRRIPFVLAACLAVVGMVVPVNAATAVFGPVAAPLTEEKGEENRGEEQRSDASAAAPLSPPDRSRHRHRSPLLPSQARFEHLPSASPPTTTPRTESGHTLRNGLGTYYRC